MISYDVWLEDCGHELVRADSVASLRWDEAPNTSQYCWWVVAVDTSGREWPLVLVPYGEDVSCDPALGELVQAIARCRADWGKAWIIRGSDNRTTQKIEWEEY